MSKVTFHTVGQYVLVLCWLLCCVSRLGLALLSHHRRINRLMEMQAHLVIVCHDKGRIFHYDISLLCTLSEFLIVVWANCDLSSVIKPHRLLLMRKFITWIYNIVQVTEGRNRYISRLRRFGSATSWSLLACHSASINNCLLLRLSLFVIRRKWTSKLQVLISMECLRIVWIELDRCVFLLGAGPAQYLL